VRRKGAIEALPRLRARHPYIPGSERDVLRIVPDSVTPRDLIARLTSGPLDPRSDLTGGLNRAGGSAGQLGAFAEIGAWFFKTSMDRRFAPGAPALGAEAERERLRRSLHIYPPERVWFVSQGADGALWCCSLTPTLPVLRDAFNAPDAAAQGRCWSLYLDGFRTSFDLAAGRGLFLDCNPNNFVVAPSGLYYVDDDLGTGPGRAPFGHQALLRLREYEESPLEHRKAFLEGFAALVNQYREARPLQASLLGDLQPETTWPRDPELRRILAELVADLVRDAAGTRRKPRRGGAPS